MCSRQPVVTTVGCFLLTVLLFTHTYVTGVTYLIWENATCPEPPPVPYAYRNVTEGSIGYDVTYRCYDDHSHVRGDLSRSCDVNGTYTGSPPQCTAMCRNLPRPAGLIILSPSSMTGQAGTSGQAFCDFAKYPIVSGQGLTSCSEGDGQWLPWALFCAKSVPYIEPVLSSEDASSSCKMTQAEMTPYWQSNFSTSSPPTEFDVSAVIVNLGPSMTDGYTLTLTLQGGQHTYCGEITPGVTKVTCQLKQGRRPWGYGLRITAHFQDNASRPLEICSVTIQGREHLEECTAPPVIPRLALKTAYRSLYESGDTVLYGCTSGMVAISGSGISKCSPFGKWSYPTLLCTDEISLSLGQPVLMYDSSSQQWMQGAGSGAVTDGEEGTALQQTGANNYTLRIGLDAASEVYAIAVLMNDGRVHSVSTLTSSPGLPRACEVTEEANGLTTAQCQQRPVAEMVDVTIVTDNATTTATIWEVRVFGRHFAEPLECSRSANGVDYKGRLATTTAGNTCVAWSEVLTELPHLEAHFLPDSSVVHAGNFCRNPRGSYSGPMCYVRRDNSLVEEMCEVPVCESVCRIRNDGQDYRGTLSVTSDGRACVQWDDSNIPFRRLEDFDWPGGNGSETRAHNYCRNPGGSQSVPWCYTNATSLEHAPCHVPLCQVAEMLSSSVDLFMSSTSSDILKSTTAIDVITSTASDVITSATATDVITSVTAGDVIESSTPNDSFLDVWSVSHTATVLDLASSEILSTNGYGTIQANQTTALQTAQSSDQPISFEITEQVLQTDLVSDQPITYEITEQTLLSHSILAGERSGFVTRFDLQTSFDVVSEMFGVSSTPYAGFETSADQTQIVPWTTADKHQLSSTALSQSFTISSDPVESMSTEASTNFLKTLEVMSVQPTPAHSSNVESTPTQIPHTSTTKRPRLCPCACHQVNRKRDVTNSEYLTSVVESIRSELHVPTETLSSTIRAKTSAPDHRKSSVATGVMGIVVLAVLGCLLLAADVISVVRFLKDTLVRRMEQTES